jgi:hypothetical protein
VKSKRASTTLALKGGKGGIRTLDSREAILVFETSPFNHSGTSPISIIISETLPLENARFYRLTMINVDIISTSTSILCGGKNGISYVNP